MFSFQELVLDTERDTNDCLISYSNQPWLQGLVFSESIISFGTNYLKSFLLSFSGVKFHLFKQTAPLIRNYILLYFILNYLSFHISCILWQRTFSFYSGWEKILESTAKKSGHTDQPFDWLKDEDFSLIIYKNALTCWKLSLQAVFIFKELNIYFLEISKYKYSTIWIHKVR